MSYLQQLRAKYKQQQGQAVQAPQEALEHQQELTIQQQPEPVEISQGESTKILPECEPYSPQESGMIQCKDCQHWQYSQCRNKGYGSADPERWRRCRGYEKL